MSSYKKKIWEESLLPFEMIEAAANGNMAACQEVLIAFENYIEKVCMMPMVGNEGQVYMELNLPMKQMIEQKLLNAIANKFEILPLE